jgi:hypothetical protein
MKGKNKIIMCQAEAIEAMQFYLTNKLLNTNEPAPKVVSVKQAQDDSYKSADIEIEVEEKTDGA